MDEDFSSNLKGRGHRFTRLRFFLRFWEVISSFKIFWPISSFFFSFSIFHRVLSISVTTRRFLILYLNLTAVFHDKNIAPVNPLARNPDIRNSPFMSVKIEYFILIRIETIKKADIRGRFVSLDGRLAVLCLVNWNLNGKDEFSTDYLSQLLNEWISGERFHYLTTENQFRSENLLRRRHLREAFKHYIVN